MPKPLLEPNAARHHFPRKKKRLQQFIGALFLVGGGIEGTFAILKLFGVLYICPAMFYSLDPSQLKWVPELCYEISRSAIGLFASYSRYAGYDLAITVASIFTGVRLLIIRKNQPTSIDKLN